MAKFDIEKYSDMPDIRSAFERKIRAAVMFGYIKALSGREVDGKCCSRNEAVRLFIEDSGLNDDKSSLESLYVHAMRMETKHNKQK